MLKIMNKTHIPELQQIDALAFKNSFARTPESIESYIADGLDTGLVHVSDAALDGYIFNHIWGSLAWFGPLGVNPHLKSKGVGKELIKETLKIYNSKAAIDTIMLSTMPDSPYNIGFYSRLGFTPTKLTIQMTKEVAHFANSLQVCHNYKTDTVDTSDIEAYKSFKREVTHMSNALYKGLDLSSSLDIIKDHDYGFIVSLRSDDVLKGFAVCYSKAIRETQLEHVEIKLLCITGVENLQNPLDLLLWKCANIADSMNFKKILVSCNTENADIYHYLINNLSFQAVGSFLNMTYGKADIHTKLNGIMLCRFAG